VSVSSENIFSLVLTALSLYCTYLCGPLQYQAKNPIKLESRPMMYESEPPTPLPEVCVWVTVHQPCLAWPASVLHWYDQPAVCRAALLLSHMAWHICYSVDPSHLMLRTSCMTCQSFALTGSLALTQCSHEMQMPAAASEAPLHSTHWACLPWGPCTALHQHIPCIVLDSGRHGLLHVCPRCPAPEPAKISRANFTLPWQL